jgi:ADP-ribose diphosphatase
VEERHLLFSNGEKRCYERLQARPGNAVMVVPVLNDNTILLIREYGCGIHDYYLGFPKGFPEAGESPLEAANRELKEEAGYGARELSLLASLTASPGYMSARMDVVLARDLFEERLEGDEPEAIEVVPWRIDQLDRLLARDDFHEARSIAALFMVRDLLRG